MQQEASRRRLAAARFPDNTQGLATVGGKRNVVDRPHGCSVPLKIPLADREMLRQAPCFDERRRCRGLFGAHCSFTSRALRRLSLSWLKQKEVKKIITPGRTPTPGLIQIDWRSVFSIRPQSGVGGCTPKPRKFKPAEIIMLTLTRLVAKTRIGPSTFLRT